MNLDPRAAPSVTRSLRPPAAAGAVVAVLALVQASGAASATLRGSISYASFDSAALGGTMHFSVYLPAGYASSGVRYPVLYFLRGLPGTPTSYRPLAQVAAAVEASGRLSTAVFRLYPGGHSWTLWGTHTTAWIRTALTAAAKPV